MPESNSQTQSLSSPLAMTQSQTQSQNMAISRDPGTGSARPQADASSPENWNPLSSYQPREDAYDELYHENDTEPRGHWRRFISTVRNIGPQEVERRWAKGRRLFHENGVTYNVYGDPLGVARPWSFDPVPLLISEQEWRRVESALIQRARILNTALADFYGPQRLLREAHLPPGIILGHRHFLRPLHQVPVPGNTYLHMYAADLARSPDGQWWVLSDRTQSPSGSGYALENRTVLSRIWPDLFRESHVERLGPFFETFTNSLTKLARHNRDNPRMVLLTPGPYNETYFEHAYLSRFLGITLVEGEDLTVRDNRVYLKTLSGLQQVDIIVRRVDDDFCDPLDLRSDSLLGVPGLVRAVQSGNVTVANALGSGLIQNAALMAFLAGMSRYLLGEDLLMPSVATWWCGQRMALNYVAENIDHLVIKGVNPSDGIRSTFGGRLSKAEQETLLRRIRTQPSAFLAQEAVRLSTAPVWENNKLAARPIILRVLLASDGEGGYRVLPGGLTRYALAGEDSLVSMQRGGGAKDTWIISERPTALSTHGISTRNRLEIQRSAVDLPSRVADNLFWLARYAERSEDCSRLMRCILTRITDESGLAGLPDVRPMLHTLARRGQILSWNGDSPDFETQLLRVIFDPSMPGSLRETTTRLHRLASVVRDRLSSDTWRILNQLDQDLTRSHQPHETQLGDALDLLNSVIVTLAAFSGLGNENTTHGQGWRFLDMGRRLERALALTGLLRTVITQPEPDHTGTLEALLEVCDSAITYRSRYSSGLQFAPVIDLILCDENNPRSLAYQLAALSGHIEHLPHLGQNSGLRPEQRSILSASTSLKLADLNALAERCQEGTDSSLYSLLNQLEADILNVSEHLTRSYFAHSLTGTDSRSTQMTTV